MDVLIIQPPAPGPVLLDQTGGRVQHVSPPWQAHCLLSYLRQRTRHTGRVFDARVRRRWEHDLAGRLAEDPRPGLAAIVCGRHELIGIKTVVALLRRHCPDLPLVGIGELPTREPGHFLELTGMEYGILGDPEPTLRHLLDNFTIPFRRQRIAGLLQDGVTAAAPLWVADLKTLALPAWSDVSLGAYDSPAYPAGTRIDLCLSRGAGPHPIDALARPEGAPLRTGALDQLSDALQDCAHLGILDVHFADPPDFWDAGRLEAWLDRLERVRNTQDWSLRLLALPLGANFRARLAEQHCRRIELLVPSCHPVEAARLGYELPDPRDLLDMTAWFAEHGVQLDLVFWVGGPDEPRGEARRIMRFIRSLRFPPFALEARPDVPAYESRLADIARDVRRRIALSPGRRLRSLFTRIRSIRVTVDVEHRDLITRQRPSAQTRDGERKLQPLETDLPQNSNERKS